MSDQIKRLNVATPQGSAGSLWHESQFVFNYMNEATRSCEVSLTMPLRAQSYSSNALLPVFAMNRPEGALLTAISQRLAKHIRLDDMRLLSIIGHDQIGRLTLFASDEPKKKQAHVGLQQLLKEQASKQLFDFLLDTYFDSGISGVQPKVMIPDAENVPVDRMALLHSDLIVKSGGEELPFLSQNEFVCMDAARRAGIDVPEFWLSDDGSLFVMRRFDLKDGMRHGFEDMAVLAGKLPDAQGRYKYEGKYEGIAAIIQAFCGTQAQQETRRFFKYFALSCMVRNGDAHLKNFGLTYTHPNDPQSIRLAPLYDVVTTAAYDHENLRTGQLMADRTLALKLNKSNSYPTRKQLIAFGATCHEPHPEQVIERIATAMTEALNANRQRFSTDFFQRLRQEWDDGRRAAAGS